MSTTDRDSFRPVQLLFSSYSELLFLGQALTNIPSLWRLLSGVIFQIIEGYTASANSLT